MTDVKEIKQKEEEEEEDLTVFKTISEALDQQVKREMEESSEQPELFARELPNMPPQEPFNLSETLARIRAATVQKILVNRSMGNVSNQEAQDLEIEMFIKGGTELLSSAGSSDFVSCSGPIECEPKRRSNKTPKVKRARPSQSPKTEDLPEPDDLVETLARIRAANVQKILEKRSIGKFSTGKQRVAQDLEIANFLKASLQLPPPIINTNDKTPNVGDSEAPIPKKRCFRSTVDDPYECFLQEFK